MHLIFDLLSEKNIDRLSSFSLNSMYNLLDPRFGVNVDCDICGKSRCYGHFATLDLGTYIVHPMFTRNVTNKIKSMCPECNNEIPVKRPKSYSCNRCSSIIDRESLPTLESIYSDNEDSVGNLKRTFEDAGMREQNMIIRYILVPPPGLRPKYDIEWPSDLSQAYTSLIDAVSRYKKNKDSLEYRSIINKHYGKIVTGGRGSVIDKLISSKSGIFREIIRGKRVENSARSVITEDPI